MAPLRILIVEDSPLILARLQAIIGNLAETELLGSVTDGVEAIAAVERLHPDAVILDVRLPGANGIEVLQQIKGRSSPPIVIMLTAFPLPQYRQKSMALGADYFFDKSLELDQVAEALGALHKKRYPGSAATIVS